MHPASPAVYETATVGHYANPRADAGPWPADLDPCLPRSVIAAAEEIRDWPGYAATPLRRLDPLAERLGLDAVLYKDEATRFGLGSFKALGGAYAVGRLLQREVAAGGEAPTFEALRAGRHAAAASRITVVTATDGNHGRSVAWGARLFGCQAVIYIHAGVSAGREAALAELGARVVRVRGNYDASVRQAADDARSNGWFVVSDTSYAGYTDLPRHVMAGYTVMAAEVLEELPASAPPTHVFVQGGVGALAAAVCAYLWQALGPRRPRTVVVEPETAACLYESARHGAPRAVEVREESLMAGLSCGEVSMLAWAVLERGAHDFLTIPDALIAPVMRGLAGGFAATPIVGGESGVAGLAALLAAAARPRLRAALGLEGTSRVLVLGTEGDTDPDIYRRLVGRAAAAVCASG